MFGISVIAWFAFLVATVCLIIGARANAKDNRNVAHWMCAASVCYGASILAAYGIPAD